MKKIRLAVFLGFIITVFVSSQIRFERNVDEIRNGVLRLHILANSDSAEDQALKLLVRDRLLQLSDELLCGDYDSAVASARKSLSVITSEAEKTLRENGCSYRVECSVGEVYFEDREYEGFTMPAGTYTSLCVEIGEAQGKNWWCVMYPPLCLGACEEENTVDEFFNDEQSDILENCGKYEIRFKCVDIIEEVGEFFSRIFS